VDVDGEEEDESEDEERRERDSSSSSVFPKLWTLHPKTPPRPGNGAEGTEQRLARLVVRQRGEALEVEMLDLGADDSC
jgi:hypothetical protein